MPTRGSIFGFRQGLPIYAEDQAALYNKLSINKYHSFSDDVTGALKFYSAAIVALDDEVRISKRWWQPQLEIGMVICIPPFLVSLNIY